MNDNDSNMAANAICFEASRIANTICDAVNAMSGVEFVLKPKLFIDGDKWCALYGDDLQTGVAGFGNSPAAAYMDFNTRWYKKIEGKAKR